MNNYVDNIQKNISNGLTQLDNLNAKLFKQNHLDYHHLSLKNVDKNLNIIVNNN